MSKSKARKVTSPKVCPMTYRIWIRVGVTCPDSWLDIDHRRLKKRLEAVGELARGAVKHYFGYKATKGMINEWAQTEKEVMNEVHVTDPEDKLHECEDALRPLIDSGRVVFKVWDRRGKWVHLASGRTPMMLPLDADEEDEVEVD